MISDELWECIARIEEWEQNCPTVYTPYAEKLDEIKKQMEAMAILLGMPPRDEKDKM